MRDFDAIFLIDCAMHQLIKTKKQSLNMILLQQGMAFDKDIYLESLVTPPPNSFFCEVDSQNIIHYFFLKKPVDQVLLGLKASLCHLQTYFCHSGKIGQSLSCLTRKCLTFG